MASIAHGGRLFPWPALLLLCLGAANSICLAAEDAALTQQGRAEIKDFSLQDTRGKTWTKKSWEDAKAVVVVLLATECPVSNGYAPEVSRLAERYKTQGVLFLGLHPDPSVTSAAAGEHAAEYALTFPILLDPQQALTSQTGARVTPEGIVIHANRVVYQGRIDDKYSPSGRRRQAAVTHDLTAAIDAVLAGGTPRPAEAAPFGCPLPKPRPEAR